MHCPMCGTEIRPDSQASACSSCALHGWAGGCAVDLVACPSCGYHAMPSELRGQRPVPIVMPAPGNGTAAVDEAAAEPLRRMRAGTRGRVAAVGGDPDIARRLIAYGVAPGAEIELLQRVPTFIVRVDATELAFAPEIADDIRIASLS